MRTPLALLCTLFVLSACSHAALRSDLAPRASDASPAERPGLGTRWGEDRYAPVHEVAFTRARGGPLYLASIHYDDAAGVAALRDRALRLSPWRAGEPIFQRAGETPWGGVSIRVVDGDGRDLPGYHADDRVLVEGEPGQRYALVIDNRSGQRLEVVASVDGLDVLDGRAASLDKPGYVAEAGQRLVIEGFRRSDREVAAFRFGTVADSYAARTAETGAQHVGVIGVALFAEAGAPSPEREAEARRREQADPFPSRYASPPVE